MNLKYSLRILSCVGALACTSLDAASQSAAKRPSFQLLRQNEDWSFLEDQSQRSGAFDNLKYISLSDDKSSWISFGGELSARYENWSGFNFGAPPGVSHSDGFVLTRVRAHADLHVNEDVRVFAEVKSALATDRALPGGRRALDMDTFDLQQLFVDVELDASEDVGLRIRTGRQMLSFGAQRLVSPLPWGNALRAWDGITASWTTESWNVTGIATAFVPVDKTDFNEADADQLLYGVYATEKAGKGGTDVYWLGNQKPGVMLNGTAGNSRRHTVGVRKFGPLGAGLDGEIELAYQLGEIGVADVSAWSVATQLGFRPDDSAARYWIGLDWASGDNNPGGNVQAFDAMYPLGHAYFGYIDAVGRQNAIDANVGGAWKATDDVAFKIAGHSFWLESKNDAFYNAGGGVVRAAGPFPSSWLGYELDATLTWTVNQDTTAQVGAGRFVAGDALEQTGPVRDVNFLYASMRYSL